MINIRISDSRFWVDCNVDSDLRIYFAGDMIRVNNLLIIDGSTGTIGGKDFCIVNLRRPGSVQIPGLVRVGSPIPLFSDCVNINRGYERLNIKPLSMDTLNNFDTLASEDLNDNDLTTVMMKNFYLLPRILYLTQLVKKKPLTSSIFSN